MASQLAGVMDVVDVCEGLILAKLSGEVLLGQTLTETIDHNELASKICKLFEIDLDVIEKGQINEYTVALEHGFLIAVRNDEHVLIGLLGNDGKSSVGLLTRQIKNIMRN